MGKVLVRGRVDWKPVNSAPVRRMDEKPVQSGLAITPSDIERLASRGIAVSTPAADQFKYDSDANSWSLSPEYTRDSDRNSMWELSHVSAKRLLNARRRDANKYT